MSRRTDPHTSASLVHKSNRFQEMLPSFAKLSLNTKPHCTTDVKILHDAHDPEENEACSICFDLIIFNDNDARLELMDDRRLAAVSQRNAVLGNCGHVFHFRCLQTWFAVPNSKWKCPVCQTSMSGKDIQDMHVKPAAEAQDGRVAVERLAHFTTARDELLAKRVVYESHRALMDREAAVVAEAEAEAAAEAAVQLEAARLAAAAEEAAAAAAASSASEAVARVMEDAVKKVDAEDAAAAIAAKEARKRAAKNAKRRAKAAAAAAEAEEARIAATAAAEAEEATARARARVAAEVVRRKAIIVAARESRRVESLGGEGAIRNTETVLLSLGPPNTRLFLDFLHRVRYGFLMSLQVDVTLLHERRAFGGLTTSDPSTIDLRFVAERQDWNAPATASYPGQVNVMMNYDGSELPFMSFTTTEDEDTLPNTSNVTWEPPDDYWRSTGIEANLAFEPHPSYNQGRKKGDVIIITGKNGPWHKKDVQSGPISVPRYTPSVSDEQVYDAHVFATAMEVAVGITAHAQSRVCVRFEHGIPIRDRDFVPLPMRYGLVPVSFEVLESGQILDASNFMLSKLREWNEENTNLTTGAIHSAILETLIQYAPHLALAENLQEIMPVSTWATCVFVASSTRKGGVQGALTTLSCSKKTSTIDYGFVNARISFHRGLALDDARAALRTGVDAIPDPWVSDYNFEIVLLNGFVFRLSFDPQTNGGEIQADLDHFGECTFIIKEDRRIIVELDFVGFPGSSGFYKDISEEYKLILDAMVAVSLLFGNPDHPIQLRIGKTDGHEWPTVRNHEYDMLFMHGRKVPVPFALGMLPQQLSKFLANMIQEAGVDFEDHREVRRMFHTTRQKVAQLCNHGISIGGLQSGGFEFRWAVHAMQMDNYQRGNEPFPENVNANVDSYVSHIMPNEHGIWQINKILKLEPRIVENRELIFQFA